MRRPWTARLILLLTAIVPVLAAAPADNPHPTSRFVVAQADLPTRRLVLHKRLQGIVQGPAVHRYLLPMRRGQFAAVRIRQLDGNIAAVAFAPDGSAIDVVDQNGAAQAEVVTLSATTTGTYAIQLAMFEWDAAASDYTIELRRLEPVRKDAVGRADQLFASWYEPGEPGAALLVLRDGRPLYRRAIGVTGAGSRRGLSPRSRFDLASMSKQFTGYAIAMLVARGDLRLDDDIRRYLPEIPDYGTPISVRNLLEHTSGVRDWDGLFGLIGRRIEDGLPADEILAMAARQSALNFTPGSRQAYSNTGYVLLALIVERITRQPFDAWLTEHILAPLGTRDCGLPPGRGMPLGSSTLACSVDDLARWLANYRSGAVGGPAVLKMVNAPLPAAGGAPSDYAFGNWHAVRDGVPVVGHQGLAGRARTSMHSFPAQRLAVIYLANDGNDATYPRVRQIEDLFLGVAAPPLQVPTDDYRPANSPTRDRAWSQAYLGTYACPDLSADFAIVAAGNGIALRNNGLGTVALVEQEPDHFTSADPAVPALIFDRDSAGQVTGFHVMSEDVGSLGFLRTPSAPRAR